MYQIFLIQLIEKPEQLDTVVCVTSEDLQILVRDRHFRCQSLIFS